MQGQSTSRQTRVSAADRKAGIESGWAWIKLVNSLGDDNHAIAQLPRAPIGMDFIGKDPEDDSEEAREQAQEDREVAHEAIYRRGRAEAIEFVHAVTPKLEELQGTHELEARAWIILTVLQRSLDVPHPHISTGWRVLELKLGVNPEELCAELREFTSHPHPFNEGSVRQVAHLIKPGDNAGK